MFFGDVKIFWVKTNRWPAKSRFPENRAILGRGCPGRVVPTVDPFCPMGVIHPLNGFHYGFLRRVNRLTIGMPFYPELFLFVFSTISLKKAL